MFDFVTLTAQNFNGTVVIKGVDEFLQPESLVALKGNRLLCEWKASLTKSQAPSTDEVLGPEGVWLSFIKRSGCTNAAEVMETFFQHFSLEQLLEVQDPLGRKALEVASPLFKGIISKRFLLEFCLRLV